MATRALAAVSPRLSLVRRYCSLALDAGDEITAGDSHGSEPSYFSRIAHLGSPWLIGGMK